MAKKKKDKKKNKGTLQAFNEMLAKHQKEIKIHIGDEDKTLKELTSDSAENVTAVTFDSVIPEDGKEIAKRSKESFEMKAFLSSPIFKLFESGISSDSKQTLLLTIQDSDAPYLFANDVNEDITTLYGKSNLSLILNKMDKPKRKLEKWCKSDAETDYDVFVMRIPNVVLFTHKICKDELTNAIIFDIIVQVVKTKKKFSKIVKNEDKLSELSKFVIKCTIETMKNFGSVSTIIPITSKFGVDEYQLGDDWASYALKDDAFKNMINSVVFTSLSTNSYAIFDRIMTTTVNK